MITRNLLRMLRVFLMGPFVLAMGAVLSADRVTPAKDPGVKQHPMGDDIIYKGSLVTLNTSGYAVAGQDAAGYIFAGVAAEQGDNDGGSNGDVDVRCFTEGLFKFDASSITQAMVGQMMYIVDDHTFDEDGGTYQIPVGILVEYVSTTSGWIDIGPAVGKKRVRLVVPADASFTETGVNNVLGGIFIDQNISDKDGTVQVYGLEVGDRIVQIGVEGGIGAAASNASVLDVKLCKVVGAAGGDTDSDVQAMDQVSKEADYLLSESKAVATPVVVTEGDAFYFFLTATTADNAACDIMVTGLWIEVERNR